jgi:ubiquinone biosynthesis protein
MTSSTIDTVPPAPDYPGRLEGRERHVLPAPNGTLEHPTWLRDLGTQRAYAAALAERITHPPARAVLGGLPVMARITLAGGASVTGGVEALAPRLRRLFGSLGPTFLKLGQLISGGAGLFPPRLIEEFAGFRDALPAEDWAHVLQVITEDLPGGLASFSSFDRTPLAAASIAQVHVATLRSGQEVVVKVQRPDIRRRIEADLTWMAALARLVDRVPAARSANLPGIVEYFAETLAEELDFRLEAENMLDVAEAVHRSEHAAGVAVPRPHPTLVTRRVLVMERLRGFASTDDEGVRAAGIDTERMLMAGFSAFVEGALVHGVFHGDLHPGNIMVLEDGRYGILDYGIVGRLSGRERAAFARMMASGAVGDVRGQIEAMRDLDGFPADADIEQLIREMPADLIPTSMKVPDIRAVGGSLTSTMRIMQRHRFRLPKLLVLLSKNLIFADGAVHRFAPDLDLLTAATPLFLRAADTHRPEATSP